MWSPWKAAAVGATCQGLGMIALATGPHRDELQTLFIAEPFSLIKGALIGAGLRWWYTAVPAMMAAVSSPANQLVWQQAMTLKDQLKRAQPLPRAAAASAAVVDQVPALVLAAAGALLVQRLEAVIDAEREARAEWAAQRKDDSQLNPADPWHRHTHSVPQKQSQPVPRADDPAQATTWNVWAARQPAPATDPTPAPAAPDSDALALPLLAGTALDRMDARETSQAELPDMASPFSAVTSAAKSANWLWYSSWRDAHLARMREKDGPSASHFIPLDSLARAQGIANTVAVWTHVALPVLPVSVLISYANFRFVSIRAQPAVGIFQNLMLSVFHGALASKSRWLAVERAMNERDAQSKSS